MIITTVALTAATVSKLLVASKILIATGTCLSTVGSVVERLKRERREKS